MFSPTLTFITLALVAQYGATDAQTVGTSTPLPKTLPVSALASLLRQPIDAFVGKIVECKVSPCKIEMPVKEVFDAQNVLIACIAQVPKVIIMKVLQPPDMVIEWELMPIDPTADKYEFQTEYGILVVSTDVVGQLSKANTGVGSKARQKHKNSVKSTATYLPLVMQYVGSNEPALCAVADPKIVSVD